MIEVEDIHHSVVLQGETHITIDTDDALYIVIVEWIKFPGEMRYEEANITRVQRVRKGFYSKWT